MKRRPASPVSISLRRPPHSPRFGRPNGSLPFSPRKGKRKGKLENIGRRGQKTRLPAEVWLEVWFAWRGLPMGAVGVRLPPPPACGCRGCPSALARTPLCFNVSLTTRLPRQCLLQRQLLRRWVPRAWRLQHVPLVVPGHAEQRRRCPKGRRPKKRKNRTPGTP